MGPLGLLRNQQPNELCETPFKPGPASPLRMLWDDPAAVKIDLAHTYAIAGFGKDDAASTLIFLAVRCGVFGRAPFQTQLDMAWASFKHWCIRHRHTTSLQDFAKEELKIQS